MKRKIALITIMMWAVIAYSTPTWMWIGRFNALSCNNNCGQGNGHSITAYNEFYNYAMLNHPNGPTPYLNPPEQKTGLDVTWGALDSLCPNSWSDFLYFNAHGGQTYWMWSLTSDHQYCYPWQTYQMKLGQSYVGTRWVYFNCCRLLKPGPDFFTYWDAGFKGVQCVIGFGNDIWSSNAMVQTIKNFWEQWTGYNGTVGQWGLADAHFWSVYYKYYQDGGYNVVPVIASSNSPSNGHVYFWDTYDDATSEQANPQCYMYFYSEMIY